MKKVIVIILCVFVLVMGYLVLDVIKENDSLKSKISEKSNLIYQNENDKELFESMEKELNDIKEKNKEKSSKYDEVEAWNQEIIKYLD